MRDYKNFDFEQHWKNIEKQAQAEKKAVWTTRAFFVLQVLLYLVLFGGVAYLIAYAVTHWLRW